MILRLLGFAALAASLAAAPAADCGSLVAKQGPEGLWMEFTPNNQAKGSFHPRFNLWYAERSSRATS